MTTTQITASLNEARTTRLFLVRGVVAIAWAAVFAVVAGSATTEVTIGVGVLLVLYALIDAVASLTDARSQRGSARHLLLANVAVSAATAVALGVAATGTNDRGLRGHRWGGLPRSGVAARAASSPRGHRAGPCVSGWPSAGKARHHPLRG